MEDFKTQVLSVQNEKRDLVGVVDSLREELSQKDGQQRVFCAEHRN
jgi:hypothetical protein